jgi:hypothetical protein
MAAPRSATVRSRPASGGTLVRAAIFLLVDCCAVRADPTTVSNAQVENRSATPIQDLYIRKAGTDDWGKNAIDNTIAAGAVRHLAVHEDDGCNYDLRIVFQDGRSEERREVNLCQGLTVIEPPVEKETAQEPKQQPKQ